MNKFLIYYFLFSLSFFTFFASGFVDSQDGFQYLAVARRMYYDKTFEMPQERFLESDEKPQNIHMSYALGTNGEYFSPTGLGYTLALLPAVFLERVFLKVAHLKPISAFPLQSDWPVLLFASMTNAVFGALLAVTIYLYLKSFYLKHKTSLLVSFLALVATNLFPYTKHVYPHMMFISFLVLTFYQFRRYSLTKKPLYLIIAGVSFGAVTLSYNITYLLSVAPLVIYYLLLEKPVINITSFKKIVKEVFLFVAGIAPFYSLSLWYNLIRFGSLFDSGYGGGVGGTLTIERPVNVIFEGIWGVLLSPGKSFLLYTPILILIIIFWFKLKKKLLPEIVSYAILALIYTIFIGTLMGDADFPTWQGESSWGPRYMLVLIPFGMILIGNIYENISKKVKLFIFTPLILLGFCIQIIGILLPYQIKFAGLQTDNFLNGRNFNVYEYGNEIPRYSPILKMSSTLIRRVKNIRNLEHGQYNLRLFDGFDLPFDLGWSVWRGTHTIAQISFDQNQRNPINSIGMQFRNHQIDQKSKYPLKVIVKQNESMENSNSILIPAGQEKEIQMTFSKLLERNNTLLIETSFIGTDSATLKGIQPVFLQIFRVNGIAQNIKSIDLPYISEVSKTVYGAKYNYWGGVQNDPWEVWYMRSGAFENTFDLWWLRPYHLWDLPKRQFVYLLTLNIGAMLFFGLKTIKMGLK